jgi:hypothetical protein
MASNKQIEEVGEPREKKPPKMHLMKEITNGSNCKLITEIESSIRLHRSFISKGKQVFTFIGIKRKNERIQTSSMQEQSSPTHHGGMIHIITCGLFKR